jgi:hypothetical protein
MNRATLEKLPGKRFKVRHSIGFLFAGPTLRVAVAAVSREFHLA